MAKNSITDYSKTAASNTDIQSVDIAEGCLPSGINNAIREIMADLADMNDGTVTLTSPSFAAASLTGDLSFGDNDKAIFGAGSDLQIYHDGSDSYIRDSGSGDLYIEGADDIRFRTTSGETYAVFNENSSINLYYDNALKFATTSTGINVTGTVTADAGTHTFGDGAGASQVIIKASSTTNATIDFGDADDTNIGRIQYNNTDNSMLFRTNNSERLRITSAGLVGIGTSSPDNPLHISSATEPYIRIENTDAGLAEGQITGGIIFEQNDTSNNATGITGRIQMRSANRPDNAAYYGSAADMDFLVSGRSDGTAVDNASKTAMTIRAGTGNVGINRTSPNGLFHMQSPSGTDSALYIQTSAGTDDSVIHFGDDSASSVGSILYDHSTDSMQFETLNSERMRIDSSGRVGIGTSSPDATGLHVHTGSAGTLTPNSAADDLVVESNGNAGITIASPDANYSGIIFSSPTDTTGSIIEYNQSGATFDIGTATSGGVLRLRSGNFSEAMRIDSSGGLLLNVTSKNANSQAAIKASSTIALQTQPTSDGYYPLFIYNAAGGQRGYIYNSGTTTQYNTNSDYRLKENVTDITDGIERVKQLNPSRFNFIEAPDVTVDGFLAHEAQTIVPEAVHGEKDAVDADGNPFYQGIDQAKLVPLLTAALQEAITKIEDLEARVATLEGN